MPFRWLKPLAAAVVCAVLLSGCATAAAAPSRPDTKNRSLDELSALWSFYKHAYIRDGRVVALDEDQITTSEGQSYAMLRAVWANDPWTFESVWRWTRDNLQVRDDRLFAWKWQEEVVDENSATDAVPLFWRLAMDEAWFSRPEAPVRRKVLSFFEKVGRRGRSSRTCPFVFPPQ